MKKPELKIISQSQKIELKISQNLLGEIWNLHKRIDGLEWSGLIFYDVEGDISDPANLKLRTTDFILLDIGSAGYTEFKLGVDLFDLYDESPHLLGKQYGLMHSHHKMNAFFSGTDSENLHESASMFNFYLSLIVNHSGDFVAKVSVEGKRSFAGTTDIKNNKGQFVRMEYTDSYDCVFVYDCNIIWEGSQTSKIDKLRKAKSMSSRSTSTFPFDLDNKFGANQLPLFKGKSAEDIATEDDLGIDLVKATFRERCECYLEKLTFLTLDDITIKEELERMAEARGDVWDEIEEDSEVLLHVIFESYLTLDSRTLRTQRDRFVKEIRQILVAHDLRKGIFDMFDILFNSAFEIYE